MNDFSPLVFALVVVLTIALGFKRRDRRGADAHNWRGGKKLTHIKWKDVDGPLPPVKALPRSKLPTGLRCEHCGWPVVATIREGCTASNCSMRPMPPWRADISEQNRKLLQ